MKYLQANEFLKQIGDSPLIDVRSPAEFARGHIPGAVNIALFSDDERHDVGIVYKRLGRIRAIQKGLELVGPKMAGLANFAAELSGNPERFVYCWRGGMRSEKMAWLFELTGMKSTVLKGGYKAFRRLMLKSFEEIKRPVVLQGPTGSGKTAILKALEEMGEQVLDLEGMACHKGSAFGATENRQPSSEQFHNNIYAAVSKQDLSRRVWLEAESPTIGKVHLPDSLWEVMKKAPMVMIDLPAGLRVKRLVDEYGSIDRVLLNENIGKLKEKIGGKKVLQLRRALAEERLHEVAAGLLDYYDGSYRFSRRRFHDKIAADIPLDQNDPYKNAAHLVQEVKNLPETIWKTK